jgi:DNA-binding SARP family transcriptional activator
MTGDGTGGPGLDFRVLGPLRVLRDGAELGLGGRKQRAVLAALLIRCNRVLAIREIADSVWDADPPATATSIVQVYVSELRRVLAPLHADQPGAIQTVAPGYRLTSPDERYDLARFHRARAEGERARAAARPEEAGQAYRRALGEWSAPVLADLRGLRFADAFAAAVEEDRLLTVQARIEVDLACGRQAELVGELMTLTDEHPMREGFWAQLMLALYRCGRQAEALAAFRTVRTALRRELGIEPGPALQQLERSILHQQDVAGAAAAPPVAARLQRTIGDDQPGTPGAALLRPDGSRVGIDGGGLSIGRLPECDLVLEDVRASRQHAMIAASSGGFVLTDLHSRNGTTVGGTRITGSRVLEHGDRIAIGSTVLIFLLDEPG